MGMPARRRAAVFSLLVFAAAGARAATADKAGIVAPLPAAAGDEWIELRTPSFVTLTNAGERKGREIALGFERFRAAMQMLRPQGIQQAPVPTLILVFKSDKSFDPYKPAPENGRGQLLGLFQQSQLGNYILINGYPSSGSALPVVYHEYAHSVMHASFADLPLWLDEGMAELYATFEVERGELLVGKPLADHVRTLREKSFVPLQRLFAVDHDSPEYNESERVGMFYAESWLVVHYLMLGGEERLQKTRAFLDGIASGQAPEAAFRGAFGYGFDQLEKELRGYVNAPTFAYARLPQGEVGPEPSVALRAVPRGEVLLALGSSLALRSGDPAAARAHLEAAAAAGVADAWAMLGFVEERGHHDAAEEELYKKAVDAGAARPVSLMLAARSRLEPATATPDDAHAARALLERALQAEPSYAEARALLGKTWMIGDDDPAAGIAHLEKAYEQLGGRVDVAYDLAMLELRAGHLARAEELVRTVVVPHGSAELAAHAQRALEHAKAGATVNDALASGDAGRAITALQAALAEATDPELRGELEARLQEAKEQQTKQAEIERYNAAVAQANAGKLAQARTELRALRAETTDAELQTTIDDVLAKLDKALKGRG
ncbi:MAG TPA: hypothetical protein VGS57_15215 [Thermoanaerobaculia bacterium]|jgi:hypothetical protein|nr:hypothetical protein [Thermoanaerobaculia bacterium]